MSTPRHLRNAPITEAILDIRVKARHDFDPALFSGLRDELRDEFPKIEERKATQFQFQIPATQPPAIEELGLHGIFFRSENDALVAQFRLDGFTLNRLKPYTSWEDVFARAKNLWGQYVKIARPEAVTRLALRYINHISLPLDMEDFNVYMRVPPEIPPELPQEISAFFYRVTLEDAARDVSAHIVQSIEVKDQINLLLDIDAFRIADWQPGDASIYETLEQLREFKNQAFFSFLTDEAIRRFE